MSNTKKRTYTSQARKAQAEATRMRILTASKRLFETEGFEQITIEKIARTADVSSPTVYALFQSKRGILRALMDEALPTKQFQELVEQSVKEKSPEARLALSAKIARQLYEAESAQMDLFRGASIVSSDLKDLEKERELRRYKRQEVTIQAMVLEQSLAKNLDAKKARDILWALTGRDLYRLFVIEQGWTADEYESWLTLTLISALVNPSYPKIS